VHCASCGTRRALASWSLSVLGVRYLDLARELPEFPPAAGDSWTRAMLYSHLKYPTTYYQLEP